MFERESRREKIIEGKMREVRLKGKVRTSEVVPKEVSPKPAQIMSAADLMLEAAEKDFHELLLKVKYYKLEVTYIILLIQSKTLFNNKL